MSDLTLIDAGVELQVSASGSVISPIASAASVLIGATGQTIETAANPASLTISAATSIQALEIPRETLALSVSEPQGPQGSQRLAIGPEAPSYGAGESYLWVQTGLGDGSGMTFWIEDGL